MRTALLLGLAGLTLATPAMAQEQRPLSPGVGIGVGMTVPTGPLALNTASVRFRLSDTIALEPTVVISSTSSTTQVQAEEDVRDVSSTNSSTIPTFGTNVRVVAAQRGPVDLVVLGGAAVSFRSTRRSDTAGDPEVDVPTFEPSSGTTFNMNVGLGVEAFIKPHWSVGMDARVPLVRMTSSTTPVTPTDPDNDDLNKTSTTSLAIGWAPAVSMMTHIYF